MPLRADEFAALLRLLGPDDDQAALHYEQLRQRLLSFFRHRGCTHSEDLVDITIDRLARKLFSEEEAEEPPKVAPLAFGIARYVFLEHVRKAGAVRLSTPRDLAAPGEKAQDPRFPCLERCLDRLAGDDRDVLLEYYQHEKREKIDGRLRLAERLGSSINSLRQRVCRVKKELEGCLVQCLGQGT